MFSLFLSGSSHLHVAKTFSTDHSLDMITTAIFPVPAQVQGVSLICRRDKRFLLVKRGKEPLKGWLAFPGGSVEPGETAEEAAKRELKEETALHAARLDHMITVDLATGEKAYDKCYYLSVFRAHDITGMEQAGDDAVSIHWLSVEEMEGQQVTESTLAVARSVAQAEDTP